MRKFIYISGVVGVNIVFIGALFKRMHWPGAGILLTIGIIFFCCWVLPASLINSYKGIKSFFWWYLSIWQEHYLK